MSATITLDAPIVPTIRRVRTASPARRRTRPLLNPFRGARRSRHASMNHQTITELRAVDDGDALAGFGRAHRAVP